jgi:hypothetical protein
MILPDEDIDSKTDRAEPTTSPRPPHHDSPAPVRSAPGTPEPPVPVPESTPEPEPEADSELLPPYTPRESDPLLPTSTRRRKLSLRARRVWICTLLLLLLGTIAGVLTYAAVRAPRHSSQVISKVRCLYIHMIRSYRVPDMPDGRPPAVDQPHRIRPSFLHRRRHNTCVDPVRSARRVRLASVLRPAGDRDAVGVQLQRHHRPRHRWPPQPRRAPADRCMPACVRQLGSPSLCGGVCVSHGDGWF